MLSARLAWIMELLGALIIEFLYIEMLCPKYAVAIGLAWACLLLPLAVSLVFPLAALLLT